MFVEGLSVRSDFNKYVTRSFCHLGEQLLSFRHLGIDYPLSLSLYRCRHTFWLLSKTSSLRVIKYTYLDFPISAKSRATFPGLSTTIGNNKIRFGFMITLVNKISS